MNKLLFLLETLTDLQREDVVRFLRMPSIHKSVALADFLEVLLEHWSLRIDIPTLRTTIIRQLKKTENEKNLDWFKNCSYQLHKRLQLFVAMLQLSDAPGTAHLQLAQALIEWKADGRATNYMASLRQTLEQLPLSSEAYFQLLYQFQQLEYFHPFTGRASLEMLEVLQQSERYLDIGYHVNKVRLAIEYLARQRFLDELPGLKGAILADSIAHLEMLDLPVMHSSRFFIPLLLQTYQAYRLHSESAQLSDLERLRELGPLHKKLLQDFERHAAALSSDDRELIYAYLVNLTEILRAIQPAYIEQLKKLIEVHFSLLDTSGRMLSEGRFLNMVATHALSKDFEEARLIIEKYQRYLSKSQRKQIVILAESFVSFHENDHYIALKKVQSIRQYANSRQAEYGYPIHLRSAFGLYLEKRETGKSFADLEKDAKQIQRVMRNFREYIKRNDTWKEDKKKEYLNFLDCIRELFIFVRFSQIQEMQLEVVRKIVEERTPLFARPWLVEQIEKLEALPDPWR